MSAALILGFASTGFSQTTAPANTPTFELSAGYQYLHVPDQNFPFGLAVDGAKHFGPLGLVGEVGWARHSDDDFGADVSTNMFHFAAGPRWTMFGSQRAWPYFQVLAGAAVGHSSVEIAGVDSMFGQVDYRRTFFDEPDDTDDSINNQFRVFIGLRMILD
jgi:hypothetical protein